MLLVVDGEMARNDEAPVAWDAADNPTWAEAPIALTGNFV
jgi:hypothetical protein